MGVESRQLVAVREEEARLAGKALDGLSSQDREILVLRELEGFSGEETADLLELSLQAMKSRLHRARLRLAAELMGGSRG